jgi:hypothetical protein
MHSKCLQLLLVARIVEVGDSVGGIDLAHPDVQAAKAFAWR